MSVEHLPDGTPYLSADSYLSDTPKYTQEMARHVGTLGGGGGIEVVTELPDTADEGTLLNYYTGDPGDTSGSGAIWTMRYTPITGAGELGNLPWLCVGGGYAYGYQDGEEEVDWSAEEYPGNVSARLHPMECPVPLAGYYRFDIGIFFTAYELNGPWPPKSHHLLMEVYGTTTGPEDLTGLKFRDQEGARGSTVHYEQNSLGSAWGDPGQILANMRPITDGPHGPVPPWPADDTASPNIKNPAYGNHGVYHFRACYIGSQPWRVAGTASGRALSPAYIAQYERNHAVYLKKMEAHKAEQQVSE